MNIDGLSIDDDKALRAKRFQPDVIGAGRDGSLDSSGQQLLKSREKDILKLDGERQQPVEEGRDRRKLILQPIGVHKLQSGRVFEPFERAAFQLAAHEQQVKLTQRIAAILAFQIVLRPEQALPSGLALTSG